MKTKIVMVVSASIYLMLYGVFFSDFYVLAETNWFVYSRIFAVTLSMAIITVFWLPFDWILQKMLA